MKKTLLLFSTFLISCTPSACPDNLSFDSLNTVTYVNDELYTGRCATYDNGKLRSIQQYLNGKDYGKWKFYFSSGKIETTGRFNSQGKRIGKWRYFYSNGNKKQISSFSNNGEVKGRWVTYDSIGNITSDVNY